jgi:hypothetical protein
MVVEALLLVECLSEVLFDRDNLSLTLLNSDGLMMPEEGWKDSVEEEKVRQDIGAEACYLR